MLDSGRSMSSILLVCTGNICRSAMAQGFLRDLLDRRFDGAGPEVRSAGTNGFEDSPAVPEAVRAAAERGVDISGHRGRRLARRHVLASDLVLGMAAHHAELIVRLVPEAAPRTFTLKELVRLLRALPSAPERAGFSEEAFLARIAQADALRRGSAVGASDQDVPDPLGGSVETFRVVASELDDLCARLVAGLFGSAPARAARAGRAG